MNYCNAIATLFAEHRKLPRITADTDRSERWRIEAMHADVHRRGQALQEQAAKAFAALNGRGRLKACPAVCQHTCGRCDGGIPRREPSDERPLGARVQGPKAGHRPLSRYLFARRCRLLGAPTPMKTS